MAVPRVPDDGVQGAGVSTDILVDGEETETARWVTRDEYTIELSEAVWKLPAIHNRPVHD